MPATSAALDAADAPTLRDLATPAGLARVSVYAVPEARGVLLLGHGAGGGISARDLTAARDVALGQRVAVALVEQPYRVAGRRSPAPPRHLDAAFEAVITEVTSASGSGWDSLGGLPVITGGRSSGARVACRTAAAVGAAGVLCLAFPFQPPGRTGDGEPRPTRIDELDAVKVPVLIVQGDRDPFGTPPARRGRKVVTVTGDHSLRSDLDGVRSAIRPWLNRVLGRA